MDEDGVDVVEAIDAWIDEEIDDLTDDELEVILEILDAVSASTLANVDADEVDDVDIAELVELAGGSADDRSYTDTVLRAALFGESLNDSVDVEPVRHDDEDEGDLADADQEHSDDPDLQDHELEDPDYGEDDLDDANHDLDDVDQDDHDLELDDDIEDADHGEGEFGDIGQEDGDQDIDDDDGDEPDGDLEHVEDPADDTAEHADAAGNNHDGFLSDLADAESLDHQRDLTETVGHDSFLAELASTRDKEPTTAQADPVRPVELRAFDELGPSFLSEVGDEPRRNRRRSRRLGDIVLPVFMIVGLAAFAFGMVQLIDSLNEDGAATEIAAGPEATATATPEPTAAPTQVVAPPTPVDPSAPTPTPTPEPTPPARIGIRLVTGDIMVASFPDASSPAEVTQVYDVSDEDLAPARHVTWLSDGLGIVDSEGNVLIVDPDDRRPRPTVIYEVGGGFGEATKIASVDGQLAVLTEDGDITLSPSNGRADPDVIQIAWDAAEEGAKATDLSAVDGLVPFVLDNGNAQMIVTREDNAVVPIWIADEQPPAFNVGGSPTGILLGVGQGAVARYNLDSDAVLESVWDPFTRDDAPAIGYSSAGSGTAIVTGDGAIVLADDSGGGPLLWDPELTEIRAFIALGTETQVVVLLETGSVVRIPLDPDELIESIWDITDETLSPANQVIVEPAGPEEAPEG